jgi:hypothetical protein
MVGAGKSAVASWICSSRPDIKLIEVDEIKIRKYGSTAFCNPLVDFPEAGSAAHAEVAAGHGTIVVEAFYDEQHLNLVLGQMNLTLTSPEVSVVWLECDANTALARKAQTLPPEVIRLQHARHRSRFRFSGELVIRTDALAVEQVAQRILTATAFGKPSGS